MTALSIRCPGAVPDRLAFLKSSMCEAIDTARFLSGFCFVGDNAYPDSDSILTPCTRRQVSRGEGNDLDNYNFYLSQLRINIECCFGMLVNKFPILQSALLTTRLGTAVKIFTVCCIIHNLCIDERLERGDQTTMKFPLRQRYQQKSQLITRDILDKDADFECVDTVDEEQAREVTEANANVGLGADEEELGEVEDESGLTRKEKMIRKIARLGYVRPRY